ncbi:MAG TPA: MFS transporter [Patescibacteria group bacterium]|nr:MFS transporter [Patescibacteria group bacterium]
MSEELQTVELQMEEIKPLTANKNFLLIMTSRFVSFLGDSVHYFALSWYIINVIGQGKVLGLLLTLSTLPAVFLGPFVGVLADRFDRRKIMITVDVIRGVLALTLGYLVYIGQAPIWVFFVVTLLLSISSTMYFPASGALFPSLVHETHLIKANSVASFLGTFTGILGPAVAGPVYGIVGPEGLFLLNGITFFFAAVCEFLLKPPAMEHNAAAKAKNYLSNLKEGLQFVFHKKALFAMLLFGGTVNFFFWPIQNIVQPVIGSKVLAFDSTMYGTMISFFPIGMLIATLLIPLLPQPKKKYRFMLWSMFIQSIGLILLAIPILPIVRPYMTNTNILFYTYCGILIIRGAAFGFTNVPMQVVYQTLTPNEYRGRVFALQGAFFQGLMPVSMGIAGFFVDIFPAYALCTFAGVFMGLVCIFMFGVKATKDI